MPALLRETSVIYDPCHYRDMLLHRRQHRLSYLRQHLLVIPWRIRDQMMQRLVQTSNVVRSQTCGHRLDALALPVQQKARAVVLQRNMPIGVPRGVCQALYICREAPLLWAWRGEA
jgi:hypothetical protein